MGYSNSNNIKNIIYKDLILVFIMGSLYMVFEGLWRGWTHISMLAVGGTAAFLIGRLTVIILVLEFVSGLILNVWLKLGIWDYSNTWGNLYGQICIPYAMLWFLLVPLNVFADDYLRYRVFGEKKPQGLLKNYIDLFMGR